jgi:chitinase
MKSSVGALTQLKFAFAFITLETYEVIPMDSDTPTSLFTETTDLKQINPALKVFISSGGWTFSDNDTITQPLFGEISRTAANRQKFADNLVKFMDAHSFDGVDINW